jgi:hypothetical protein
MRAMYGILILALLALTTQAGCLGRGFFGLRSRCCTPCGDANGCAVCGPEKVVTPCGPTARTCRPAVCAPERRVTSCAPAAPCGPTARLCRPAVCAPERRVTPCAPPPCGPTAQGCYPAAPPCATPKLSNAGPSNTQEQAESGPLASEGSELTVEFPKRPQPKGT